MSGVDTSLGAALAEATLNLCRISSVTGDESRIAEHIEARCRSLGVFTERLDNTVLARGPSRPGRPCVALFGHTDTVPPASGQPIGIDGGRVYGCGASDMKGGLAVMLALLEDAQRHPERHDADLRCVFYDKEEGPAPDSGMVQLCAPGRLANVDLAVCLEPTDGIIHAGCMGGLHAQVTALGRRAHSARPWQGENALYAALPLLHKLRDTPRREVRVDGLSFYEVFVPTRAETYNSRNIVPERFTLNINYRFAPGKSLARARGELFEFIESAGAGGGPETKYRIEIVDESPAGAVCLSEPRFSAWQQALGLKVAAKQAWTDVARLTELGISAVNFGPGDTAEAHQANESCSVAALVAAYHALSRLLDMRREATP
jgi:succinyl-diaminopimelate desuccinylase